MPPALHPLLQHAVIGFGLATLFVAAVLTTDFAGLGTLLRQAEGHPLPLLLLWFLAGLGFGGVQLGLAAAQRGRPE